MSPPNPAPGRPVHLPVLEEQLVLRHQFVLKEELRLHRRRRRFP